VSFHQADEHGRPDEEEYAVVQELQDRLVDVLTEGQQSLFAVTIMTAGRRDLVLYTSDEESARQRLASAQTSITSHRIAIDVERDTFWGLYRAFVEGAQEGEEEP
jgi:hypothetical protein